MLVPCLIEIDEKKKSYFCALKYQQIYSHKCLRDFSALAIANNSIIIKNSLAVRKFSRLLSTLHLYVCNSLLLPYPFASKKVYIIRSIFLLYCMCDFSCAFLTYIEGKKSERDRPLICIFVFIDVMIIMKE